MATETNGYGQTFDDWKEEVNQAVIAKAGLGCDDLPDVDYYSWFMDCTPPAEAAEQLLRDTCEDMGFDYEEIF